MEDIIDIIVTETTNLIEITSQPTDEIIDVNIIDNREDVTLNVTPSVVEININSLTGNFGVNWGEIAGTLSNQTDLQNALNLKADLVDGKVPSSQLPSYVDDVVEVANYAALPTTGETGKIYVTIDTNYIYRWTGSTYVEIKDSSAVWGVITGTLSSQTDLQNALNAKEPTITAGTTLQYWRGDKSWQTLNTTAVTEGTNLYYTDARARASISAGTGISYNSTTGVITNTITQYTDALARASISLTVSGSSGASTYNSTTGVINVPTYTLAGLGGQPALNGTGFVKISGTTISYDNSTYLTTSAAASTYVSGSGTTNYLPRWSSSKVLTDSFVYTNGNYTEIQGQGLTASMGIVVSGRYGSVANAPKIYSSDETTGVTHIELVNGGGEIRLGVEKSTGGQILPGSSAYATVLTAGLSGRNLEFGTNNTKRLTIDGSTGAATFTSSVTASSHIVPGGTSSQFLKANGTLDSTAYLSLSGGTLTGALSGTSATFSGNLDIRNANSYFGSQKGYVYLLEDQINSYFSSDADATLVVNYVGYNQGTTRFRSFDVYNGKAGKILGLNGATGAATFSSSVFAGGADTNAFASAGRNVIVVNGSSQSLYGMTVGGTNKAYVYHEGTQMIIQNIANGYMSFGTNDTERMRITSSGNVGIGTTSPGVLLHTSPAATANLVTALFTAGNSDGNFKAGFANGVGTGVASEQAKIGMWYGTSGNPLVHFGLLRGNSADGLGITFNVNNSEYMRITSSGNVGIGTTSPTFVTGGGLAVFQTSTDTRIALKNTASGDASTDGFHLVLTTALEAVIENRENGSLRFLTNATEAMRITSGGNVLIGTTTNVGQKFVVNGGVATIDNYLTMRSTVNSTNYGFINEGNGLVKLANIGVANLGQFSMTTGIYTPLSDKNKKKDFEDSTIGLNEVMQLKPTLYRMKSESEDVEKQLGFIAQEVQGIIPSAYQESGDFIGLNFNPIVAALTKAVQEQQVQIQELKEQLANK